MPEFDNIDFENYVEEILVAARRSKPSSPAAFRQMCQPDINGGSAAEVEEAMRRYFGKPPHSPANSLP